MWSAVQRVRQGGAWAAARLRRAILRGNRSFIGKFAVGIFTQGLLSLTSMLIKVWLARTMPKDRYGLYVVGFQTIFLFLSLHNALVNSPLAVLLPEKKGPQRDVLLSGLGMGQWLIFAPLVLLCGAGALLFGSLAGYGKILWALPLLLAVPAAWWREFQRVVHYNSLLVGRVLAMDLLFIVGALGGTVLLGTLGRLNVASALTVLGLAYLVSALASQFASGNRYRFRLDWIRQTFRETRAISSWALLGVTASGIQSQGYVYLVSAMDGLATMADIAAAQMFMMPFNLLVNSSQRIFLAKGAQIRSSGRPARYRGFLLAFLLFFAASWLLYVSILLIFREPLIVLVFTEKYRSSARYLLPWALQTLITACRFTVTYSLQVYKEFRLLAINGAITASLVLVLSIVLLRLVGPIGVVAALAGGELALLLLSLPRLFQTLPRKERETGAD